MSTTQRFADIILPLALPQLYTYSIPEHLENEAVEGKRAIIQFGKKKIYTCIIYSVHNNKPEHYQTKDIVAILDKDRLISSVQFKFWDWMASYYMCSLGEVYKAAVPAGLKLESETVLSINPEFEHETKLSKKETLILSELKATPNVSIKKLKSFPEERQTITVSRSLLRKGAIRVEEALKETYKPKLKTYIKLSDKLYNENELHKAFNVLKKAPRQMQLLMTYIQLSDFFNENTNIEVSKKELLEKVNVSANILNSLVEKNFFETYQKEIGRLQLLGEPTTTPYTLNDEQKKALSSLILQFEEKNVVLMHGVTASGKTEIYVHLINEYIKQGKQVLYLLPEIAITSQIINRLKLIFGDNVGVYHSKFSDAERVEIWNNIKTDKNQNEAEVLRPKYKIVLGVRSSVFLPFENLGLIIVDEEHENSYKQFNPVPRYNARDAAIVLANMHGAKVLLGTATPSFDSYYNTQNGKYGLVELHKRFSKIELPEIIIANTRVAYKKKEMKSHFTPLLLEKIGEAISQKEQVILFQNRRGFSPFLECNTCGWVPHCENCDVSLTYHKQNSQLKCHYCGYTFSTPRNCLACGDAGMQTKGFGTEKIEDELPIYFPTARVARMDLDTTRSKNSYINIIEKFENNQIDILVGTQMITKGLDFDNVSVVGILNADNMLNHPDFRAFERSFQLMSQVSGRAGRRGKRGQVIIQTGDPEHPVIENIVNNDFKTLYTSQLNERFQFKYPPFNRIITITLKHKQQNTLDKAAEQFAQILRKIFAERVLGPEYPPVNRIQNWYQKNILLKIEKEKSVARAKKLLTKSILRMKNAYPSLLLQPNVDPL